MKAFPLRPRIIQTGTYSSANKGDAAMQLSCAAALRRRWPDADIVISAPFPEQDAPFYRDIAAVVPCNRRRLIFACLLLLRAGLWRLVRKISGKDAIWLIRNRELQAYGSADLVIDLSGDMLTDDYGPHIAFSHYIPVLSALLLDRAVFVCAQSIGPFRWTGLLARLTFQHVAAITVRDRISLKHLAAIGIDTNGVSLAADMAFLLPSASPQRVAAILAAESITLNGCPFLGVSLSPILEKRYERASGGSFAGLLAKVLDAFARENGVRILFIPHVTGPKPGGDDRRVAARVAAHMRMSADVINGDYRPEELKALIGCSETFLGARMHANIAALSEGVPVVALSYSHKTPGIMALFGQQERVIDGSVLTEERLRQVLQVAWTQRMKIRQRINASLPAIRSAAESNLRIAARLLGNSDSHTE